MCSGNPSSTRPIRTVTPVLGIPGQKTVVQFGGRRWPRRHLSRPSLHRYRTPRPPRSRTAGSRRGCSASARLRRPRSSPGSIRYPEAANWTVPDAHDCNLDRVHDSPLSYLRAVSRTPPCEEYVKQHLRERNFITAVLHHYCRWKYKGMVGEPSECGTLLYQGWDELRACSARQAARNSRKRGAVPREPRRAVPDGGLLPSP